MKPLRVGLLGFGNRGRIYLNMMKDLANEGENIELVAVCDYRIDEIKKDLPFPCSNFFQSTEDFFKANLDLDVCIICTMDQYHYQNTLDAINHGYNILLEKPIAQTYEQVKTLLDLSHEKNVKVAVCYVLRYTFFYKMIKDIISSGRIGDVMNINLTENVGYWHYAHSYTRGNWRRSEETTPMILAKCSHDLDLMYWLKGNSEPKLVSSFGALTHMVHENKPEGAAEYCTNCKLKETCPYDAFKFYLKERYWLLPYLGNDMTDESIKQYLQKNRFSKCVYQCDNNVVDHQIVNVMFEDSTTASLTMNAYSRYCYRDIKIFGTKGSIRGGFDDQKFTVYEFLDNKEETYDIKTYTNDFSGHGGGDRILIKEFIDWVRYDKKSVSLTSLDESMISHSLGYGAEESRINDGKVIKLK